MANKKAAKKSKTQSQRRALESSGVLGKIRTLAKKLRVSTGDSKDVRQVAIEYISALDKAAKRRIVHRNFANRRKSGAARYLFV
ncbi:MAG: 30S ribosomal protein S20 [Puniceicoccales bacterium]|jgi:small subunit ribosomal protein S20|nr:30S ribosomal protein S20 [Puniceicoccales bacterium]